MHKTSLSEASTSIDSSVEELKSTTKNLAAKGTAFGGINGSAM